MSPLLWVFSPLIGLVLSLFAAGGGMIAVPLLSFAVGMPLKQAVATSLVIVASVSLIALLQHKRWQLIEWKLHRFFALGGIFGGFAGASLGLYLSDHTQAIIFAVMILFVAGWMHSDVMKKIMVHSKTKPCDCRYSMLAGIITGLLTGMLGIGGGFLIVPLLLMLGVESYQSAVAHSLMLIISSSLVAALRYAEHLTIAWFPTLFIVLLASLGAWVGSHISKKYDEDLLQKIFSFMLILMAIWILFSVFSNKVV